jgi:hypothetical protein
MAMRTNSTAHRRELYPPELTVVFETYTELFGVVRQVVLIVLKLQRDVVHGRPRRFLEGLGVPGGHRSGLASGANGGTLRNVVRCQLRHVALLSGPAPCDTAPRIVHGLGCTSRWLDVCLASAPFSLLAAWNFALPVRDTGW